LEIKKRGVGGGGVGERGRGRDSQQINTAGKQQIAGSHKTCRLS